VFRIIFWNIMHGGGKRADAIVHQLMAWQPDLIALAEFRATPSSQSIADNLRDIGFDHQLTTATQKHRTQNGLFLASRTELDSLTLRAMPKPSHRWLLAEVKTNPAFHIGVMHIPNMHTKLKIPYHKSVLRLTKKWKLGNGLLIGDTNSGLPDIDEESPAFGKHETAFINGLDKANWKDMFRVLHGDKREYTWYSPNGKNGFRLDQAFANIDLQQRVESFQYVWGDAGEHNQLSDHAAILLDLR
jgi:exodeoxyribonuclease III